MSKQVTKLKVEERVSPKTYQHLYQKGYRAGLLTGAEEAQGTIGQLRQELQRVRMSNAQQALKALTVKPGYALSTVVWTFVFGMVFALVIAIAALR